MLGKPVFQGTRIPVHMVLELLAEGVTDEEIVKEYYPDLAREDVKEAIRYADKLVKGEDVVLVNK